MRDYQSLESMYPLDRIRELLYPSDHTYEAEPISIEDARWLLAGYDVAQENKKDKLNESSS